MRQQIKELKVETESADGTEVSEQNEKLKGITRDLADKVRQIRALQGDIARPARAKILYVNRNTLVPT